MGLPQIHGAQARDVWRRLSAVTDPELDEPITDMGFVERLEVLRGTHVEVDFRLPTYWCSPNFAFLMADEETLDGPDAAEASDDGGIIAEASIAVHFGDSRPTSSRTWPCCVRSSGSSATDAWSRTPRLTRRGRRLRGRSSRASSTMKNWSACLEGVLTQARLVEGRNLARIHAPTGGERPGFSPSVPTLEDAYFVMIRSSHPESSAA